MYDCQVSTLSVQMDSGHPEMWKMHSNLEMAVKDLEQSQRDIQRIFSEVDHLQDNVSEAVAEASQRTQVVDDLLESQRRFETDLVWISITILLDLPQLGLVSICGYFLI